MNYLNSVSALTSSELVQLSDGASEKKQAFILTYHPKVSDLTVGHAIELAQKLSYSNTDVFLLSAVDLVTDLNVANLGALANESYQKKSEILEKGLKRLAK